MTSPVHSVRSHLHLEIEAYDETIRRFIPDYEGMLAAAARAVAAVQPPLVLDLGAGTGALSAALLERPGVGRVELFDVDPEMLAQARARLGSYGERARFHLRSYDEPFPACDAIAASLALHHIPTLPQKRALFARAFEALRAGGVLVNADVTMPAGGAERDALYRSWADHLVASGFTETRAWELFAEWAEEDTYLPLEDELEAYAGVGFEARCIWRQGPVAVVAARRADG